MASPGCRFSILTPVSSIRVLRVQDAAGPESVMVGRQPHQPPAGVRVGQPDHGYRGRRRIARAAEPGVPRVPQHQPDPGHRREHHEDHGPPHDEGRLLQQPQLQGAEHRRRRRGEPWLPGLHQLRQRHEQRARHRLRLRQCGDGRVPAVPAAVEADRRQHDLQQHRGLPPGQLEGQRQVDDRLRPPPDAPAAAVRPVPADVELLHRPVEAVGGAAPLRPRVQQRSDRVFGQCQERDESA